MVWPIKWEDSALCATMIGVRALRIVAAPLCCGQHRIETLAVKIAIVDLMAGSQQRGDNSRVQCRGEAASQRMSVDDVYSHCQYRPRWSQRWGCNSSPRAPGTIR